MVEPLPQDLQILVLLVVPIAKRFPKRMASDVVAQAKHCGDPSDIVIGIPPGHRLLDTADFSLLPAWKKIIVRFHVPASILDNFSDPHVQRDPGCLAGFLFNGFDPFSADVLLPKPDHVADPQAGVDPDLEQQEHSFAMPVRQRGQTLSDLFKLIRVFDRSNLVHILTPLQIQM